MPTTPPKSTPQDMPPPGGYDKVPWERVRLRTVFGTKLTWSIWAVATFSGIMVYKYTWKEVHRDETEMRSARHVLLPLLMAERDRMVLKQLRLNRDYERELMKNVPEWEVGTYFGEPVYITVPKDVLLEPHFYEVYAHAETNKVTERVFRRHFT